jgi:predicted RND superfamily exporter protein
VVRLSLSRPRTVVALWAGLVVIGIPGLLQLRFETTARSFLDRSGEHWARYEFSKDQFGGDEVIVVALESATPFDPTILARLADLTEAAEALEGVRRVDSISSVPVVRASTDGSLSLTPALPAKPTPDRALSDRVRRALEGDRIAPDNLVSADGRTFAANVLLESDIGDGRARVLQELDSFLAAGGARISGVPVFETRVSAQTRSEILLFVPLALLLLILVLALSTRCWMGVAVPVIASGLPCLLLLELMGVLRFPFTMISMLLPSVLLALGCAYVMHLLVATRGVTDAARLEDRIMAVARPTVLSATTTAVGFFAISTTGVDAIRDMGQVGSTGVMLALAATLTLAPALLRLAPRAERLEAWDAGIERQLAPRLLGVVWMRRRSVAAFWAALLLLFCWGLTRLKLETDAVHWFPSDSPIRADYNDIRDRLSGISPMNVVIESQTGDSVASAEVVAALAGLTTYLESLPEVGRALSIADPLRQLHGGFNDDPSQPLPEDSTLIAQYLLLLDSVEQLDDLIASDHSKTNVSLRMNHNGSGRLQQLAQSAERWWQENGVSGFTASTTGVMFEFSRTEEEIAWGQLRGLAFALGVISLILIGVIRSARIAAVALIPNAIPLIAVFGFLGLVCIPLDAGTVCLGSLALGIAVDDTTHLVLRYQDAVNRGAEPQHALAHSFRVVLPAVILSTLAISAGFGVLSLSEFAITQNLGLVTTSIVLACMIADATLLPALLAWSTPYELDLDGRGIEWGVVPLPVLEYRHPELEGSALVLEKEIDPLEGEEDYGWITSAVAMNPGYDLETMSKAELAALSMLDPRSTYSLAIESSLLRFGDEARHMEPILLVHWLFWPLALLEAMRIMLKTTFFRVTHLRWRLSDSLEKRTRFVLGPRKIASALADGPSPLNYAIRHGVTTSVALDILYNFPSAWEKPPGLRGALTWFWANEPHARGLRNRMRMVYWKLLGAMHEEHKRGGGEIRILSLACGSAQPVIEAVAQFRKEEPDAEIRVELIDLDLPSLRRAERLAEARGVRSLIRFRQENIRTFLTEDRRSWPIIEMVGFLDYRTNRSFIETCEKIRSRLDPRGYFMTATVCPSVWAAVVRWLANWPFLIRRSPRQFRRLLACAGFRSSRDHYEKDATGTFMMAELYGE